MFEINLLRVYATKFFTWLFSSPDALFRFTASTSDIVKVLITPEIKTKSKHSHTDTSPVVVYTVQMAASVGHVSQANVAPNLKRQNRHYLLKHAAALV